MNTCHPKALSVLTEPQKRQVQNSWGLPASAQVKHVQPAEISCERVVRHAAHCRVRGSFSNVQAVHDHPERVTIGGSEDLVGLVGLAAGPSWRDEGEIARLDGPGRAGLWSRIMMPGSKSSPSLVRSITLSSMLSLEAFSASRRAKSPEPHDFSSRALRSAACVVQTG